MPSVIWHPQTEKWGVILAGSLSAIASHPLGKLKTYRLRLASLHYPVWKHMGAGTAGLWHGHFHAFTLCTIILSQTAARNGLGDSKAQRLQNILDAAVGDEANKLYGCRWVHLCPSQDERWLPALFAHGFRNEQFRQIAPMKQLSALASVQGGAWAVHGASAHHRSLPRNAKVHVSVTADSFSWDTKPLLPVLTVRGTRTRQRPVPSSVKT